MTWLRWILALVFVGAFGPMSWADAPKKVALVVGNSDYVNQAHLRNPANDAKAMAAALRAKGFEVIEAENVTKAQFERAAGKFGDALTAGSTGLFYYAGHGMQVDGRNYLLPVDAKVEREERVRLEAINVDDVISQMTDAKTKVSVVILDACRNNPFERRFRSVGGGLAQMSAPEGTFIAYATAPGSVAADGTGEHGIYSQALLDAMQRPGLKVEDVFKAVRVNVSRTTDGVQVPWESSSLTGDFYFTPAAPTADSATQAELAKIAAARADLERQQAALKDAQAEAAKLAAAKADLERQQAALRLAQASGGAARSLSYVDTQGAFSAGLPKFPGIGAIDVQINVQGHRVTGFGTITGFQVPCKVVGQVEQTTINFDLNCIHNVAAGAGLGGTRNFGFNFKGPLAQAGDGTLYFKTAYDGIVEGEHVSGTVDVKKAAVEEVFGTYDGQISLTGIGTVHAVMTASDGVIAGFSTDGTSCQIAGKVEGLSASFALSCRNWVGLAGRTETSFSGRFVKENGQYVLKSDYKTSDQETGTLVWTARK